MVSIQACVPPDPDGLELAKDERKAHGVRCLAARGAVGGAVTHRHRSGLGQDARVVGART